MAPDEIFIHHDIDKLVHNTDMNRIAEWSVPDYGTK